MHPGSAAAPEGKEELNGLEEAVPGPVDGKPASGNRGPSPNLPIPRVGADFSRPLGARAGRRAPSSRRRAEGVRGGPRRGRVSVPGLPPRGPRGGVHFGGRSRGGREETPAPLTAPRALRGGPVLTLASWQPTPRCPDARAGRWAPLGGLTRTVGRRDRPREPRLAGSSAELAKAGRCGSEPR